MPRQINSEKIKKLVYQLLNELGEDTKREGLIDTPKRVADSYSKLMEGYGLDPKKLITVFDSEQYDEMIIVKDIDFYSTCEHHMLPFYGKAHIGYIPNKKIIGLSKIPRIVEAYARRMQNQERLTQQIGNFIYQALKPKGVGVIIDAEHLCMRARGIEKQNTVVSTSKFTGIFKTNSKTRNEFLKLYDSKSKN